MKKVAMFVWNHFTNDARVNRECTALAEDGYDVDLIAINDPKNTDIEAFEQREPHFRVHRVKRYPMLIQVYADYGKRFLIIIGGVSFTIAAGLFFINLKLMLGYLAILLAGMVILKVKKLRKWVVNGAIIARMIIKGYQQKADIYHSNDLNTLPQGIVCSKLRLHPKPLVYDSHEVQTDRTGYNPERIKKIERFLLQFVDTMMVENHTRAQHNEWLYGFYPQPLYNYSVLYDIEQQPYYNLHEKLGLNQNEKILLYQGGLQQGRGLEKLIEAMPMIQEGVLVFVGGGKLTETLKAQAQQSEARDRIFFLDKVPFEKLPQITREAFVGFQVLQNVCFNHYSASSNKLFEYIMAHVPVIACDFPEIKRVVEENEVGIATDTHSSQNIAAAVNHLLQHPELYDRYRANTRRAKMIYNWQNEKQKLLNVYNTLDDNVSFIGKIQPQMK
ncbi:glycosyltransferase [Staphylococcus pseudintermedius]|uniref:glycosyltransferase n=1 Tax=Staphylococcus pseudintermedius TaxID=283734 RepID=UPI000C1BCDD7|nr:glycosyltransferase [Staphylococcus pseudintermedius]EGQ2868716.1 glycosyltransferase [Staphylococcus pseudintermedius]EGQ2890801.1 glycosyltransferase [Staphylococcus pseudintermedius]EGQ4156941.1 glycosyltransferase family 4 protein [Staphylococcus pseudintermedius]EHL7274575.1 glycosyltransferase [Staphylococcus pseudintermedius]EJG5112272.1 glycosyltransferase [Staphylococcus pseudintermedius]